VSLCVFIDTSRDIKIYLKVEYFGTERTIYGHFYLEFSQFNTMVVSMKQRTIRTVAQKKRGTEKCASKIPNSKK
jgi:hypothetical protein